MDFVITVRLTNFDDAFDYYGKALSLARRGEGVAMLTCNVNEKETKILSKDTLKPIQGEDRYGQGVEHQSHTH